MYEEIFVNASVAAAYAYGMFVGGPSSWWRKVLVGLAMFALLEALDAWRRKP
jgi:hypothetical protein